MKTYQRLLLTEKQQTAILETLDDVRYKLSVAQERLEERASEVERLVKWLEREAEDPDFAMSQECFRIVLREYNAPVKEETTDEDN